MLTKLMDMFVAASLDSQESTANLVSTSFIFEFSISMANRIFIKCHGISSPDCLKNSLYFFNQSEITPKPIATRTSFSRLAQLNVFTTSFDWFTVLSVSFVIGLSDYSGFSFTTLD